MSGGHTSDDGRAKRRATAVVVALLLLVAVFVVVTLRCGTWSGDRSSVDGDASIADSSSSSAADGVASSGTDKTTPPTRDATKPRTPARRRPEPVDESPAAASTSADAPIVNPAIAESPWLKSAKTAPFGRFGLVGGPDWALASLFGSSVAIDGDIAVIAAPGCMSKGWVVCGAAYVYERRDHVWTPVTLLWSPRRDVAGFARRVAVSGTRIAVFGGVARASDAPVFHTFVRGADGSWNEEAEVPTGEPMGADATLRGDVVLVGHEAAVGVYRLASGKWDKVQTLAAPPDRGKARFGTWLSYLGDTLAVHSGDAAGAGAAIDLYRRFELRPNGFFYEEARLPFEGTRLVGCLAHAGASLVAMGARSPLSIRERTGDAWSRVLTAKSGLGAMPTLEEGRPFAADGNLVVGSSRAWDEFVVLERREDGWYRTSISVPADGDPRIRRGSMWPPHRPYVALSGRTAVVGTGENSSGDGRAWFFDVTDEDLARATKIESDAK